MRIAIALAFAVAACAPAPAARPAPSASPPPPAPASAEAAATPRPATANTVRSVGAPIDLYRFPVPPLLGAEWTTEWRVPGFAFTRLVPSWHVETPEGSWVTIEAQGRRASGGDTAWYSFGRWAFGDEAIQRASVDGQRDADARVDTDTLLAATPFTAYRLRVTGGRRETVATPPLLRSIGAVASDDAAVRAAGPSAHSGVAKDITVPQYSQEIHAGEYPQYDGGGEAWCSPTSTTMVLAHWGRGPSEADLAWVDASYPDPRVDHAARFTFDATYGGAGNWSFNVAYAAQYGVTAFVTQLRSLAEAERFIASGIPLVASVRIPAGGLPGFPLPQGSAGHLLVIRGFTESGDVISNDPAGPTNASVRRIYPRAVFERVWVGGSGGIVYVIHPPDIALPPRVDGATANW